MIRLRNRRRFLREATEQEQQSFEVKENIRFTITLEPYNRDNGSMGCRIRAAIRDSHNTDLSYTSDVIFETTQEDIDDLAERLEREKVELMHRMIGGTYNMYMKDWVLPTYDRKRR